MIINSADIIEIFSGLNAAPNFSYLLLRNIDDELPGNLKSGKDIDLLVKKSDTPALLKFLQARGYKRIKHPLAEDIYLYGVEPFVFLQNPATGIIFDLNFQLVCRSFNAGEWIPLDQAIQESAWAGRHFVEQENGFGYWTLSPVDEFVALLARAIFDKRGFQPGYRRRISELWVNIDKSEALQKMRLVFFKFAPVLGDMLERQDYEKIVAAYLSFKDY